MGLGIDLKSISFNNCGTGIRMNAGAAQARLLDPLLWSMLLSSMLKKASSQPYDSSSLPTTAGGLIPRKYTTNNVANSCSNALKEQFSLAQRDLWPSLRWVKDMDTRQTDLTKPRIHYSIFSAAALPNGSSYYECSKPQYEGIPVSQFVSILSSDAKGDGITDDTVVINSVLSRATAVGKVVFFDTSIYQVSSTILVPAGFKTCGKDVPFDNGSGSYSRTWTIPSCCMRWQLWRLWGASSGPI